MQRLITRLYCVNGKIAPPTNRLPLARLREIYEEGGITWIELQNRAVEWSTDASGRKFHYICPNCHAPMRHCPDPACQEEGVGHHLLEEDWEGCDSNIPYNTALMYYEAIGADVEYNWGSKSWCVDRKMIEKIKAELNEAIQAVLAKYDTRDHGGCEFHGELIGLIQHKGAPETATGWYFKVGNGLPEGWIGPLPGKYRCQDSDKGSSKETCNPNTPQDSNSPNGGESTAGT